MARSDKLYLRNIHTGELLEVSACWVKGNACKEVVYLHKGNPIFMPPKKYTYRLYCNATMCKFLNQIKSEVV